MTTRPSSARIVLWLLAAALALPCAAPAQARRAPEEVQLQGGRSLTPTEQFERGRQAFLNGEYERAVHVLSVISPLARTDMGDPCFEREERMQLHEMLGKSYFIVDADDPRAAEHFLEVLKLNPDHHLDPVNTPQAIIDVFEGQREKSQRILTRKYPADLDLTIPGHLVPRVAPRDYIYALAPAGVFRLLFLGTPFKGAFLLSAQLLPLGLSIGGASYLSWAADKCSNAQIRQNASRWYIVNIVSAATAWAIWLVGIIDAIHSQRYHDRAAPAERARKRRAGAGWRWGPPVAVIPPGPD